MCRLTIIIFDQLELKKSLKNDSLLKILSLDIIFEILLKKEIQIKSSKNQTLNHYCFDYTSCVISLTAPFYTSQEVNVISHNIISSQRYQLTSI